MLVLNGADDAWLDPKAVAFFKKEMSAATKDFKYVSLKGVKHSYTNVQADEFGKKFKMANMAYSKQADQEAWAAMQALFKRVFAR